MIKALPSEQEMSAVYCQPAVLCLEMIKAPLLRQFDDNWQFTMSDDQGTLEEETVVKALEYMLKKRVISVYNW